MGGVKAPLLWRLKIAFKKKAVKEKNVVVKCIVHNCGTKMGQIYKGETIETTSEDAAHLIEKGMVKKA